MKKLKINLLILVGSVFFASIALASSSAPRTYFKVVAVQQFNSSVQVGDAAKAIYSITPLTTMAGPIDIELWNAAPSDQAALFKELTIAPEQDANNLKNCNTPTTGQACLLTVTNKFVSSSVGSKWSDSSLSFCPKHQPGSQLLCAQLNTGDAKESEIQPSTNNFKGITVSNPNPSLIKTALGNGARAGESFTVRVTNNSTESEEITTTADGAYKNKLTITNDTGTNTTVTIPASQSAAFTVALAPGAALPGDADLQTGNNGICFDGPDISSQCLPISVIDTSRQPLPPGIRTVPGSLFFTPGMVATPQTVTITNTSSSSVTVGTIAPQAGAHPLSGVTVGQGSCASAALAPGGTCDFTLTVAAGASGAGTINIPYGGKTLFYPINMQQASTTNQSGAGLSLVTSATDGTVKPFQILAATGNTNIFIKNTGSLALEGLKATLTATDVTGASFTCGDVNPISSDTLAIGATAEIGTTLSTQKGYNCQLTVTATNVTKPHANQLIPMVFNTPYEGGGWAMYGAPADSASESGLRITWIHVDNNASATDTSPNFTQTHDPDAGAAGYSCLEGTCDASKLQIVGDPATGATCTATVDNQCSVLLTDTAAAAYSPGTVALVYAYKPQGSIGTFTSAVMQPFTAISGVLDVGTMRPISRTEDGAAQPPIGNAGALIASEVGAAEMLGGTVKNTGAATGTDSPVTRVSWNSPADTLAVYAGPSAWTYGPNNKSGDAQMELPEHMYWVNETSDEGPVHFGFPAADKVTVNGIDNVKLFCAADGGTAAKPCHGLMLANLHDTQATTYDGATNELVYLSYQTQLDDSTSGVFKNIRGRHQLTMTPTILIRPAGMEGYSMSKMSVFSSDGTTVNTRGIVAFTRNNAGTPETILEKFTLATDGSVAWTKITGMSEANSAVRSISCTTNVCYVGGSFTVGATALTLAQVSMNQATATIAPVNGFQGGTVNDVAVLGNKIVVGGKNLGGTTAGIMEATVATNDWGAVADTDGQTVLQVSRDNALNSSILANKIYYLFSDSGEIKMATANLAGVDSLGNELFHYFMYIFPQEMQKLDPNLQVGIVPIINKSEELLRVNLVVAKTFSKTSTINQALKHQSVDNNKVIQALSQEKAMNDILKKTF